MRRKWLHRAGWAVGFVVAIAALRVAAAHFRADSPVSPPSVPTHGADAFGDPLPEHTVARLGTIRFRCAGGGVWAPDGKHLFVVGWDDEILAMNAETGLVDWTLPGHAGTFTRDVRLIDLPNIVRRGEIPDCQDALDSIAITADGRKLVTAGYSIRVWDIETRKQEKLIPLRGGSAWPAVVSPDGTLAAFPWGEFVRFVDLSGGRERPQRIALPESAPCVAWTQSGDGIVAGLAKGKLAIGKLDGSLPVVVPVSDVTISAVLVVNEGRDVWALDANGVVTIRSLASPDTLLRRVEAPPPHPRGFWDWGGAMHLSPDGRIVAVSWKGKPLRWLDAVTAEPVAGLTSAPGLSGIGWSPDGGRFAGFQRGALRIFGDSAPSQPDATDDDVRTVAISPDGRSVVTGSSSGVVQVWDLATSRHRWRYHLAGSCWSVAWTADGASVFATAAQQGRLGCLDAATGKRRWKFESGPPPRSMEVNRAATAASWCDEDGTLRVLDLRDDARTVRSIPIGAKAPSYPSKRVVSADLRRVAVIQDMPTAPGQSQTMLRVWDAGADAPSVELKASGSHVLTLSSDGRLVASGGSQVTVHDLSTSPPREVGRILVPRPDHVGYAMGADTAAFSPDTTRLALGDPCGTIHVYSLPNCVEVKTLRGHRTSVLSVAFSPDGALLVSGSADTTALVWDLRD